MIRTDYDVWYCATCHREWVVPSLPHNAACPICGKPGWWKRFTAGRAYHFKVAGSA
jgi:ribosomal protein L37AE/L43A